MLFHNGSGNEKVTRFESIKDEIRHQVTFSNNSISSLNSILSLNCIVPWKLFKVTCKEFVSLDIRIVSQTYVK